MKAHPKLGEGSPLGQGDPSSGLRKPFLRAKDTYPLGQGYLSSGLRIPILRVKDTLPPGQGDLSSGSRRPFLWVKETFPWVQKTLVEWAECAWGWVCTQVPLPPGEGFRVRGNNGLLWSSPVLKPLPPPPVPAGDEYKNNNLKGVCIP